MLSGSTNSHIDFAIAHDHFDLLAQGIPNPCFYLNRSFVVEFVNNEFAVPLGKKLGDILGRSLEEVLGQQQFARHEPYLRRALNGEQVTYDSQVGGQGDQEIYYKICDKPVYDEAGAVKGVFSAATDISDLMRLERIARQSELRFRALAEGVPNQLLFLDRDLKIEFANNTFLESIGWTQESAQGRHISEVVGEERYLLRRENYETALAGENVFYESQGAAGSHSGYFRFAYRPSFDAEGHVRGIFSMASDVTEHHRLEMSLQAKQAELERSNRDLEQFAYVASHDLKAPLRSIEVLVQWIREELDDYDGGGVQQNLNMLSRRTQRLSQLLEDLLAYSRAGRKVGDRDEVDSHQLVLDTIQLLDPPDNTTVRIRGRLPAFNTYATPLEQVFRNLIGNAIKHQSSEHGEVIVSCEERNDHFVFSVQDDGDGIPPEYAERVFEMFQTLKPRDKVEGSGMGLAIVNRIVSWQGGRVWFEPAPTGRGTVFKFLWCREPDRMQISETA
jgi:PAS domain S-box-containing protein